MQRSKAILVALSLFALALAPTLAAAANFGVEAFGSFSTYSMKDVNDAISAANQAGSNFDNVSNGLSGGLGLKMWANQNWAIGANWEPLRASTESATTNEKFNVNSQSFMATGTYFLPSATNARYGFGAGLGYYSIGGKLEDPTGSSKIEGSGVGFQFHGTGEWSINKQWAFTGLAGYRLANVEMKDEQGNNLTTASGDKATADYSGFMGRVGVVMYFPTASK
jgi:autotransporter-like protein